MTSIAVIGATGHIGQQLVPLLLAQGLQVRAIGRDAERLQPLVKGGATSWIGSVDSAKSMAEAFRGMDGAFVMIPPDYGHPDPAARAKAVAEALAAGTQVARVKHVVVLSSIGAHLPSGVGPVNGLRGLEERFNQIDGMNVIHLRPGYFMENLLNGIGAIESMGVNGGALKADLPVALTATKDIATVAATLLARPSFTGQTVRELLGPRTYTHREASLIIGDAIGMPGLGYMEFSYDDTRKALLTFGFSEASANDFIEMYDALNTGRMQGIQPRSSLTTTPTTLEEFAKTVFAPAYGA